MSNWIGVREEDVEHMISLGVVRSDLALFDYISCLQGQLDGLQRRILLELVSGRQDVLLFQRSSHSITLSPCFLHAPGMN